MRDFNTGGDIAVHGDMNVGDNFYSEHKLLIHCSSEELLQERPFRQANIRIEQSKKLKRLKPFYAASVISFIAAAAWATANGKSDLISFLMGSASILLAYASLKAAVEPNAFQVEERNAVDEISKILKQRRVE